MTSPSTRAVSSVVEHHLDMVGVTGSNPVLRTILLRIGRLHGYHDTECLFLSGAEILEAQTKLRLGHHARLSHRRRGRSAHDDRRPLGHGGF